MPPDLPEHSADVAAWVSGRDEGAALDGRAASAGGRHHPPALDPAGGMGGFGAGGFHAGLRGAAALPPRWGSTGTLGLADCRQGMQQETEQPGIHADKPHPLLRPLRFGNSGFYLAPRAGRVFSGSRRASMKLAAIRVFKRCSPGPPSRWSRWARLFSFSGLFPSPSL